MAGIERICELTGQSNGSVMHNWKKDSVQVMPKYRKYFRDQEAMLVFFAEPTLVATSTDEPNLYLDILGMSIPKWWTRKYWQYRRYGMYARFPSYTWDYVLYCPGTPGIVDGAYWNHTDNPDKVLRNITKLCPRVSVSSEHYTLEEFMSIHNTSHP